ncbi:MAG: 3-deoxy-D-manno-octulosonic acid transferase [Gammaproteobacteria bacterium]|nr:3-deoxy-D-manno-octulosonic acid transferase [Gammaproteobacteria bacterium]
MIYRLFIIFFAPIIFLYTLKIALRYQSRRYLKQRYGFALPAFRKQPIWIHCASVGEFNTVLPLLKLLIKNYPQREFLITTTTPTAADRVEQSQLHNTTHCYFPIDTKSATRRFLQHCRPAICLVMETEIWPMLYLQCKKREIPLSLINARLSAKTLSVAGWIKKQYKKALDTTDKILLRSDTDRQAYISLGADESKLTVVGNLKFSADTQTIAVIEFSERPYILIASTSDNEEKLFAEAWKTMNRQGHLMVIAPRHPERSPAILNALKPLALEIAVRSQQQAVTGTTDIYLADTLGELNRFIAGASLVFVGGSLVPRGGQNVLEPARLGKAIITGSMATNFQNEIDDLIQHDACIQVDDIQQAATTIEALLADPARCEKMGQAAQQRVQQQADVADRYLAILQKNYADILSA